jgi:hypothetical protein
MLFIDWDILTQSSFGSLVVAQDSNVGDSAFNFSSEASSYASKFEDVVEQETTHGVANIEDEFIPPCEGYSREQWVDLDVVLLNGCGVPVADGVCRNSNPTDCLDANPLGEEDVSYIHWKCLLVGDSLSVDGLYEVFFTMLSACGNIPVDLRKCNSLCLPQCVPDKVGVNMIPFVCLVNPRNVVKI